MSALRVAILSFAHYHANFWAEVFRDSPGATFVGIWDDEAARGAEAAQRFGTRYWPSIDALLDAVDAVAITSETAQHRALIEAAAARKLAVLCEKPIAATREDAAAIAACIAASGIVFMQSFPKRFDPVNHEIRRLLAEGFFGRVWLARVRHGHRHGLDPAFTRGWWTDPARSGGGTLLDEGVHAADFLRWCFGDPVEVSAMTSNATLGLTVEDTGLASFRWADGMLGEIATGWAFQAADVSIEIFGTQGTAVLAGVDLASKDHTTGGYLRTYSATQGEREWSASPIVPQFKRGEFHQQNALAFLAALRERKPPPIGVADGMGALAMILAAYEAARSGRRQAIDYDFGRPA
ncbi:MAG: Gfo/Idh/MocA family oxidoreductase [Alphaproteobacteria bacterium]|nr:Gfo/Idh/MocA family oxidoreductase [Alphaproteobacteria bacterium]